MRPLATSTLRDYRSRWKAFEQWAAAQGLEWMDEVTAGDAERFAEYLVQDMKISPRRRNGVIETCRVMFERAGDLEGLGGGLVEDFAEVTDEECGVPVHHGDAVIWRVRNLGEGIPRDVDADADFLCGHVSGLSTRTMPGARAAVHAGSADCVHAVDGNRLRHLREKGDLALHSGPRYIPLLGKRGNDCRGNRCLKTWI